MKYFTNQTPLRHTVAQYPVFLLVLWMTALQAQPLREQLPRTSTIDLRHIHLELAFDWTQQRASGTAALTFAMRKTGQVIALDAGQLTIQAVRLQKGGALTYQYDGGDQNDGLQITLDRRYRAGEVLTLEIDYHTNWVNATDPDNLWGSYGKGLRFFRPSTTEPRKRRQLWSVGEPEANRYWFPSYDAPNDLRSFELIATVDTPLIVLSNGKLIETSNQPGGKRRFHWILRTPHANHQSAVVIGNFKDHLQRYGATQLHTYGYLDEYEAVKATSVRLPDMFRFFSEKTGLPYPYPAYSQVTVQEYPWGGGHNASFSTVSENMIDDYGTHADFFYLWDGVEAQDLAAQWFCNVLTPRDWEHAWLCKSMSVYFDCLYSEYKNGRDEMLLWNRPFQLNTYLGDWQAGIRRPVVTRYYDQAGTMVRDNYASQRGALVLHMLRKQLGEDNWWKAIRLYVRNNAHQLVDTDAFRRAVEAAAGEPMGWFFDQWLYKIGHPVFEVMRQYDAGAQRLTLRLKQVQTIENDSIYAHAGYFQGKMDIEIDGRIETVQIRPQAENVFQFKCPVAPKLVQVDYQNTWIKEIKTQKTNGEWQYQFEHDSDVTGRREAMLALVAVAKQDSTRASTREQIYASFRKVIAGTAYWRVRYAALLSLQGLLAPNPATAARLDSATLSMLHTIIRREGSWNRAAALTFLGTTRDPQYAGLYRQYFSDTSDRVVNAAAVALGKSKSPEAFDALIQLKNKPSWKNQSLISALNGLKALEDPRGAELALAALSDRHGIHWTLATPVWDYRLAAAETLATFGRGDEAYSMVFQRLQAACREEDENDVFSNVLLVVTLGAKQGADMFDWLRQQYAGKAEMLAYVAKYEDLWKQTQTQP